MEKMESFSSIVEVNKLFTEQGEGKETNRKLH